MRGCPDRVVFDGQSLNLLPGPLNGGFPTQVMAAFPGVPTWNNPSIGGCPWDALDNRAPQDVDHFPSKAINPILIMNGGTADIAEQSNSGPVFFADQKSNADRAHAAGFATVINVTLVPAIAMTGLRTTVAAGSNGLNVSTLNGEVGDVVNVVTTAGTVPASDVMMIYKAGGGTVTIIYGAKTGTSLTSCTTTDGSGTLTTGDRVVSLQNMERAIANASLVANLDAAFDAVVDFDADANLHNCDDFGGSGHVYSDGTHWRAENPTGGAYIAAQLMIPVLATFLS